MFLYCNFPKLSRLNDNAEVLIAFMIETQGMFLLFQLQNEIAFEVGR